MVRQGATPVQMALTVAVVCAVAAGGLAGTYAVTRDRIAAQDRAAEEKALHAVLPEAAAFVAVDAQTLADAQAAGGETPVSAVWRAESGSGDLAGWGVRVGPRGYGGPIQMVIGLDRDGTVTGVNIVSMNETPGLGTRVKDEPAYLEQFKGLSAEEMETEIKQVDAITGATKSSRGVRHGVEAAAAVYAQVLAGEAVSP